jgi:hypothetical protein
MNSLRDEVKEWALTLDEDAKKSVRLATARLCGVGISPRAAERLALGTYGSEPRELRPKIIEAMAKDVRAS